MTRALPRLVVNFKTYAEATGHRAVALCEAALRVEAATGVRIALAVQAVDVAASVATGALVYAQHFDRVDSSQSTGATRWESLVDAGVQGSLLNHSERRLDPGHLAWHVRAVERSGLVGLVCAADAREAARVARLRPTLVAVEPPELIGGDVSVTSADPGVVRRSVDAVHRQAPRLPVLCGAGVKNGDDVAEALRLGAYGVLVASGVTKAKDPRRALKDLAGGVRRALA